MPGLGDCSVPCLSSSATTVYSAHVLAFIFNVHIFLASRLNKLKFQNLRFAFCQSATEQQLLSSLSSVPFDAGSNRRSVWRFARLIRRFGVFYDIILGRAAAANADHDRLIIAIDCVHFSEHSDDDDALPLSSDCRGLPFLGASLRTSTSP